MTLELFFQTKGFSVELLRFETHEGWIVLSCYKLDEYCLYAWMLLSISGFTMLISNYTSMNYYMPKLIGTSITLLCGVFDASASMGKILGVIYDNGVTLESIFIAMAILSLTTIVKSCILHPYKPIPKVSSFIPSSQTDFFSDSVT